MPAGYYDRLVTRHDIQWVSASGLDAVEVDLEPSESAEVLSRHLQAVARRQLLADNRSLGDATRLTNNFIAALGSSDDVVGDPPRRLTSLLPAPGPGSPARMSPPLSPLSQPVLLTNAPGEPSVGSEIGSEMGSADRVDLLCAFVKWYGVRTLERSLRSLRDRGVPFRVITSTYLGSTEAVALNRLIEEFGAEVRVSYETTSTRLHAKAWLFQRDTGFDTAYVGSSNLSRTAMLDGLEWNVRLTTAATPDLIRKFTATFESYWNDPAFEPYTVADTDRLNDALQIAGGSRQDSPLQLSGLQVRPYPHQAQILESLDVERTVHDRHRNLVVAATGTGKTVVAALDYQRLADLAGGQPSLLFVAHRKEILGQALRTYREVLADGSFGELLVDGQRPQRWRHVFASVQALGSAAGQELDLAAFDVVVIDEFHHAEAATYRRILERIQPVELVGMTATPERGDGVDVRSWFGGRAAFELRLWDALGADLLCPFHYFAVNDGTDLEQVAFRRGSYAVGELSKVYTGNDARSRIVLAEIEDKVADPKRMRALGFCAGVEHARYMAEVFNRAGLAAVAVSGQTPAAQRRQAVTRLQSGALQTVFTADLFNEGVDIPEVDTVLFLRPTESATIFLQQLGRGLRRTRDKAVLTVLDFVGHHRKEFNLAGRLQAVTGGGLMEFRQQVEHGFPFLPSGSRIVLDEVTQERVLTNVRQQLLRNFPALAKDLHQMSDVGLAEFLECAEVGLDKVIASHSWTELRRRAGLPVRSGGPREPELLKRVRVFAGVDDADRVAAYRQLLADDAPTFDELDETGRRYASMLVHSLWPRPRFSVAEGLQLVREEAAVRDEIGEVLDIAVAGARHVPARLEGRLAWSPLRCHASYTREELLSALGYEDGPRGRRHPGDMREGVVWLPDLGVDVLLVTVNKTTGFSPTTMYRDYAISADLFHWESQSQTTLASPTGQRYVGQRSGDNEVLLFVRDAAENDFGKGAPYLLLGQADYVNHRGEKPIAITWKLRRPMPASCLEAWSVRA